MGVEVSSRSHCVRRRQRLRHRLRRCRKPFLLVKLSSRNHRARRLWKLCHHLLRYRKEFLVVELSCRSQCLRRPRMLCHLLLHGDKLLYKGWIAESLQWDSVWMTWKSLTCRSRKSVIFFPAFSHGIVPESQHLPDTCDATLLSL